MQTTIINARGTVLLKEAIRIVAFNEGHNKSSRTIIGVLENHPSIKKELEKLKRSPKKKPA